MRLLVAGALLPASLFAQERFSVTDTSVRQGRFSAIATSRDTILSSYPRAAREVRFRFSINGVENEFPSGTEHTIYLRPTGGRMVTPLYRFGVESAPPPPTPEQSASSEDGIARLTFRVDLRHVLRSLRERGWYDPPLGKRIARGELAHVYVLGDPAPLTWEYGKLRPGSPLELTDADSNGIYEGTVEIPTEYARPRAADGRALWARRLDLSAFPALESSQRLQDALYRLSLEELLELVRPDGAFSAGAKWEGVWTRDVALSAILSLAIIAPDATRKSLMAKVDASGRIIQDTGTGGSWPVSSDRMVWALAAWELYAATGDRDWLRQAYGIIRRSAEADLHAVRDATTGLFNGESSFLDWREQSYPRWMQPADIYRSQNLGTNVVHFGAYRVLADMSRALGEPSAHWDAIADSIAAGMTRDLWQPDRGWYAQFRYGRIWLAKSPRSEGLGEALSAIYAAANLAQRRTLMARAPLVAFGTPTFWPFIPGERFYHNATIWPFVTAYWTWAAAEGHSTTAAQHGLDNLTRATALFLTNKENMVASTGHYEGTALNSDRQLWSVAGLLAGTYRVLFGMRLAPERLVFRPMVPPSYGGTRTLRGVRYRGATLDITVRGHGDAVRSVRVDGQRQDSAFVLATLTGRHTIEITMNGRWRRTPVNMVQPRFAPATPRAVIHRGVLRWTPIPGAVRYMAYRDGVPVARSTRAALRVRTGEGVAEYQVLAVNAAGDESFLSEPVRLAPAGAEQLVRFAGANPHLRITRDSNTIVTAEVTVDRDGEYALDVHYANGNGPVNTEDKVAIRTLLVDSDTVGVLVLPQRGTNRWEEWGWSSVARARMSRGTHRVSLIYTPADENMNRRENTALVERVRVSRVR